MILIFLFLAVVVLYHINTNYGLNPGDIKDEILRLDSIKPLSKFKNNYLMFWKPQKVLTVIFTYN